jgi:hypothetical protein
MIMGKTARIFLDIAQRRSEDDAGTFTRENIDDAACIHENFFANALW